MLPHCARKRKQSISCLPTRGRLALTCAITLITTQLHCSQIITILSREGDKTDFKYGTLCEVKLEREHTKQGLASVLPHSDVEAMSALFAPRYIDMKRDAERERGNFPKDITAKIGSELEAEGSALSFTKSSASKSSSKSLSKNEFVRKRKKERKQNCCCCVPC